MQSIETRLTNGVMTVTLNRPEVYNSFNREMAISLQQALDGAAENGEVRCVVIRGSGKAFSAGQDLNEVVDPNGPELTSIVKEHYNPIVRRIRNLEKPVIAAVNGVAAGAGANIALSCDIVIASERAAFIQAFSKIGLIPDSGGTYILPRLVGWQRALALAILGDKVDAAAAEEMGMIYKCVGQEDFEDFVGKTASILATMPTKGIGLTKRAFNTSFTNSLDGQLGVEEELQTAAGNTRDYKEGVSAFLEKRKPVFRGE